MKERYGVREVAKLADLSPATISAQITGTIDNAENKRGELLKKLIEKWEVDEIKTWGSEGIPKAAVIRILKYYSFESPRNTRALAYKNYCRLTKKRFDPDRVKPENKPDKLYLIGDKDLQICKIGVSFNPKKRLQTFNSSYPFHDLELLSIIKGSRKKELSMHNKFKKHRIKKEWFYITEDILKEFNVKNYILTEPKIEKLTKLLLNRV